MLNCGLDDRLMARAIGQIMLIVLSYLAENERITTKQRQAEGINSILKTKFHHVTATLDNRQ